jgi:peroxiredoxin
MKDISITDYLGPGVYLLYNYPQESGALIAEKGYKVCYCEDVAHLADIIDDNKADFILISDNEGKFDEYIDVIRLSAQSSVKKSPSIY